MKIDWFLLLLFAVSDFVFFQWGRSEGTKQPKPVDTAIMENYCDSLLREHWSEVCADSNAKWDSINKRYER